MHPDVDAIKPKLKEVLYDCAVELRATKAALYLFDGESRYELVTDYGFRTNKRQVLDRNDALVDRCGRGRTPFFVNGLSAEPRLSEIMFESSTDRMLVVPLFSHGRLVGLLDMRDKAASQPFDKGDFAGAQQIADRILDFFTGKNVFGHRLITLSSVSSGEQERSMEGGRELPDPRIVSEDRPIAITSPARPPAAAAGPSTSPAAGTSRVATLVAEAQGIARRMVAVTPSMQIGESEAIAARDVLRALLLLPDSVTATLSVYGRGGGFQESAARSILSSDADTQIQSRLNAWLAKRGEPVTAIRSNVFTPLGTAGPPIVASDVQKVFTAPVKIGTVGGVYLTVTFASTPERATHDLLSVLLSHLQLVIEQSLHHGSSSILRGKIAAKLLEPDLTTYPTLRRHSQAVAATTESFAQHLGMSSADAENARLTALVHDVGMRLLDYDRLYRKKNLTEEERGMLREHVSVGAAVVEPLLGNEIARGVLCHHERVDGSGYPSALRGDEIPLLSRIVQLCDAWVAMTDPETYHPTRNPDVVLGEIRNGVGTQFDAELARRFIEMQRA